MPKNTVIIMMIVVILIFTSVLLFKYIYTHKHGTSDCRTDLEIIPGQILLTMFILTCLVILVIVDSSYSNSIFPIIAAIASFAVSNAYNENLEGAAKSTSKIEENLRSKSDEKRFEKASKLEDDNQDKKEEKSSSKLDEKRFEKASKLEDDN